MAVVQDANGRNVLCLWSVPRGRSTAFYRMMKERGDHIVLYGPFTQLRRFGELTVGDVVVRDDEELIEALLRLSAGRRVFFEEAGIRHLDNARLSRVVPLLREAVHTFLVREPKDVIASQFARAEEVARPLERDVVGFEQLARIHDAVVAEAVHPPVVINSDDLVDDPPGLLRAYCSAVGVPFIEESLTWRPDPLAELPEIMRGAQESTMRSTGFAKGVSRYLQTPDNTPKLAEFLEYHTPFYRRLNDRRIVVADTPTGPQ